MSYHTEAVPSTIVNKIVQATALVAAPGNASATATDYLTITLPTIGRWRVQYAVRGFNNAAGGGLAAFLATSANVEIAGSKILVVFSASAVNIQSTATGTQIITTTAVNTQIKLRIHSINGGGSGAALSDANNGHSWIMAESI